MDSLRQELLRRWGSDSRSPLLALPGFSRADAIEIFLSRHAGRACHSDEAVAAWLDERRRVPRLTSEIVPLDTLEQWHIDAGSGNVVHNGGRFFTITGLTVRHRFRQQERFWDQPMIDQAEIGILGILVRRIAGILHFGLQAKEEPGNIGGVQLSPTVQATYSNYIGSHGGSIPPLVERFLDPPRERILFGKLQTEDGGRFLYKSNRNLLIRVGDDEELDLGNDFVWLTLRQIAELMRRDNVVHACTRGILAALTGVSATVRHECGVAADPRLTGLVAAPEQRDELRAGESLAALVQWFDDQKAQHHFRVQRVGLKTLAEWHYEDGAWVHRDRRFFRIIGLNVAGSGREVARWSQPILDNPQSGIIGLLVREGGGRRDILMQAKAEPGNRTTLQLAPTVQFTPGNYADNPRLAKPFLFDEFSRPGRFPLLSESRQSEEGARFYREDHLHRILLLPPEMELELPSDYRWVSEEQLAFFLQLGVYVNSCARSILACLL